MTATDRSLLRLARLAGVSPSYRDAWNKPRRVSPETLRMILIAMGFGVATPGDIAAAIAELEAAEWRALLPPVVTAASDAPATVPLTVPEEEGRASWSVILESGKRREGAAELGALEVVAEKRERRQRRRRLALPFGAGLPPGYHRLTATVGSVSAETVLIVAPRHAYLPPELEEGGRAWGATVQLYALRSVRNWGIGDFTDLATLAAGAARRGARTLGINPLHALFPAEPRHISPYSPSSRRFLNSLYIDPAAVPDFAHSTAAQAHVAAPEVETLLAAARDSELVDYERVALLKWPIFEELYRGFAQRHLGTEKDGALSERGAAFRRFQREGGGALAAYATFTALHGHMMRESGSFCWQDWPAPLRDATSPEVARFAVEHRPRIELHQYLQWEAERQLGEAARAAEAAGLSIGLYRDLAVGVDPNGAEAWADPSMMVTGASVGAPPDALNLKGQDWGLAPVNPVALRQQAYAPFIAALRANMRHAGVLRIDHVMALMHLYWVPRGVSPAEGAYVDYPFDDLRRVLALESHRQSCAVIGEDLGTVPAGFRETMKETRVLSYRLVLFERGRGGRFLPPEDYPELATASFSTHDLATLKGFWLGRDLEWRRNLDLYPSADMAERDRRERQRDRRRLLDALLQAGTLAPDAAKRLLPSDDEPIYEPELAEAVHRFLGHAKARLALMQVEDAVGELEQANLPGTVHEHPNWRRKLSLALDQVLHDPLFLRVTAAIAQARQEPELRAQPRRASGVP
ncbi:MAG TPA: 4-alpha-glucanotransferase [Stellaceae bacterium]